MASCLCDKHGPALAPFADDIVSLLEETVVDKHPEVKLSSCQCVTRKGARGLINLI